MGRPWAEIDWKAGRPDERDIAESLQHLAFRAFDVELPAVTAMLDELRRTHVNGGALIKGFAVDDDDTTLHWFASRNRFLDYRFFRALLDSAAVRETLPELEGTQPLPGDPTRRDLGFKESWGTLTLDGELAALLVHGGAYKSFQGTPTQAKQLGTAFVDALVGERHAEFKVYRSFDAWSPWFHNVAWDSTWLLIDQGRNEVILLCVTDTDVSAPRR